MNSGGLLCQQLLEPGLLLLKEKHTYTCEETHFPEKAALSGVLNPPSPNPRN